tara:strand:+ start:6211 stop:6834 length:624 start_codon:yes stop_codon:yes gene_type:complete
MLPQDLKEKFYEWRNDTFLEKKVHFEKLAKEGQSPKYMIISCVDSRVDPNSMFKTEVGDFFVHRNIANLVPPYDYLMEHSGTIAAIEFGITALNIKNIIVMGHSGCGGIKNGYLACKENKFMENSSISNWLQLLKPAYMKLSEKSEKENIGELEKLSIVTSLENLSDYPFIKKELETQSISLYGIWNDIGTGSLESYCHDKKMFESL